LPRKLPSLQTRLLYDICGERMALVFRMESDQSMFEAQQLEANGLHVKMEEITCLWQQTNMDLLI
jgi:hypothetical protein